MFACCGEGSSTGMLRAAAARSIPAPLSGGAMFSLVVVEVMLSGDQTCCSWRPKRRPKISWSKLMCAVRAPVDFFREFLQEF